jgi:amidase
MPTQHNSSIYKGSFPQIDASSIAILRHAGALIFGTGPLLCCHHQ